MKKKELIPIIIGCLVLVVVVGLLIFKGFHSKVEEEPVAQEQENEVDNEDDGIETGIVFAENVDVQKKDTPYFEDPRHFTEEELMEELQNEEFPEGSDTYEINEEESPYTVTVENIHEMADQYHDSFNCVNLKYYIMIYLRKVTGNMNERYVATLVEGSCKNSDSSLILTVDATIDKYPDIVLHIEYDKVDKVFGISSELGDYSLEFVERQSLADIFDLEFDLESAKDEDTSTLDTVTEVE